MTDPIELLSLEFGGFPEISDLNPRFLPGRKRLKAALEIDLAACHRRLTPSDLLRDLRRVLPRLADHSCCGESRLADSLFASGVRRNCAIRGEEDALDVAHLLEHVIIDLQHFIGRMRICSGVTCALERPGSRYDLFIETPGPAVGRLCSLLAVDLVNGLLGKNRGSFSYPDAAMLARVLLERPGAGLSLPEAASLISKGADEAAGCLTVLMQKGFAREMEMTINFSGTRIFGFVDLDPAVGV